jgi:hypothetical protein
MGKNDFKTEFWKTEPFLKMIQPKWKAWQKFGRIESSIALLEKIPSMPRWKSRA